MSRVWMVLGFVTTTALIGCGGDKADGAGSSAPSAAKSAPAVAATPKPTATVSAAPPGLSDDQRKELFAIFDAEKKGLDKCAAPRAAMNKALEAKDYGASGLAAREWNLCRREWFKGFAAKTSKFNLDEDKTFDEMVTWYNKQPDFK